MADDPHRDILPVKEGSCVGTCRSTLVAGLISDPRERHSVRKLDRYELEDRYLCLLDESQALKKLINSQEDKLKRLTTKLMRITASTRPCLAALALDDGKIRMAELERENAKLKERMFVLKSQIFSYRGVRVSPQRRCTHCTSSRPLTCRSEGTRTKTSTSTLYEERKTEYETKQRMKIEELESQRQDMLGRISELEEELINCKARLEKEKEREVIVDNKQCEEALEMIKEQEKKLSAAEESNASLKKEIENLRQRLEEKSNDHERISAALLAEKNRMTEVDGILAKTHDSEMSLREKDEQIRALTSEIKILQQHNAELIALSTQGSEVEVENANLRKQLAEQQADHNNLKSSFSLEQANVSALQAVNSQLMEKLQNLQTHMDSLTIELKTIQSQNGKSEKSEKTKNSGKLGSSESPKTEIKTLYRKSEISDTSEKSEVEKLLYEKSEKFEESERAESNTSDQSDIRRSIERVDKMTSMTPRSRRHSKDNESPRLSNSPRNTIERKESSTQTDKMTTSPREFCSTDRLNQEANVSPRSHGKPVELITTSPRNNGKSVDMITSGGLTGDEMLKLLDQAQINDKPKILQYENYSPRNRQRGGCCCFEPNCSECDAQNLIRLLCNTLNQYSNVIGAAEGLEKNDKNEVKNDQNAVKDENVDQNNNTDENVQGEEEGKKEEEAVEDSGKRTLCTPCSCCDDPCGFLQAVNLPCPPARTFKSIIDDIHSSLQKTLSNLQESEKKINSKHYEVLPKLKNKVNCRKLLGHCNNNCTVQEIRKRPCCPIRVMSHQGLLEIHISSLHLSSFAVNHLFGDFTTAPSIFISCDFCGQGSIFPPTQSTPNLTFNSSCIYRILKLPKFLECLQRDPMYFQIYAANPGSQPCIIATGKISVKDLLDYPQNKLHYIVDMESAMPCYRNESFGQIYFWIKLSCDVEEVRTFHQRKDFLQSNKKSPTDSNDSMMQVRRRGFSQPAAYDYDKSYTQDDSLASSRKRQRKSTVPDDLSVYSGETLQTIHDYRRRDTRFASTPKSFRSRYSSSSETDLVTNYDESQGETLQKKADSWRAWSTGDHPVKRNEIRETIKQNRMANGLDEDEEFFDDSSEVKAEDWHRYKRRSLNSQQLIDTSDAVVIRIERLSLFPRCPLIQDQTIHQLYVEFSFLGNFGRDLETVSIPIPDKTPYNLFFNYMKKFPIDEKHHSDQRKKLEEMMSDEVSSSIKFTIVNEPLMEEMETKECVEVGSAYLNLREHILKDGHHDISLKVSNADGSDTIGTLKITLLGADAIRSCIPQV